MLPVLVSTSGLESFIHEMLADQLGQHFSTDVTNMISRLCDSYNHSQDGALIDAALKGIGDRLENYAPVDIVVEMFVRLVGGYVNKSTHFTVLEYETSKETIVIDSRLKPKKPVINTLIEEYRHAESQGDYLPARYRRAFEGLV
ncbi:hypothetical protein D3C85_14210 [compost metagenome]